ncbi:hypothetical protein ACE2AJ_00360 [Aquihabitans daechungensis]|uniref:hypothetical protein n=1 Tax=Aquihabitans daechungensis TaxID=1052257 RepID=UPI003B9E6039
MESAQPRRVVEESLGDAVIRGIDDFVFRDIEDEQIAADSEGYVKDAGFPDYDLAAAKKAVDDYVADGGKAEFALTAVSDRSTSSSPNSSSREWRRSASR